MGLQVTVAYQRAKSDHFPREAHKIHQTSLNEAVSRLRYTSNIRRTRREAILSVY
jgi:hypothetical protein